MKIDLYSHNYAYELLQNDNYKPIYDEIINVCKDCPLPIYKEKSAKQPKLEVVQQIINTYFDLKLTSLGWDSQPLVTSDKLDDKLKADFSKTFKTPKGYSPKANFTVIIEVELGNNASYYRDLYKFLLAYSQNSADFCILIVPTKHIAPKIDSGIIEFEKPIRELKDARLNFPIPILVIGLDDDGVNIWDTKKYIGNNPKNLELITKNEFERKLFVESYINFQYKKRNEPLYVNDDFKKNANDIKKLEKKVNSLKGNASKLLASIKSIECSPDFLSSKKIKKKYDSIVCKYSDTMKEIKKNTKLIIELKG
ncbi:MAG: hypothetical protein KHY88_10560 [Erysipelotrichaceae bacterium]|nr:hypothetical protein [Erysipelotrichaceae bacterium]